jgi:hypothetical protein
MERHFLTTEDFGFVPGQRSGRRSPAGRPGMVVCGEEPPERVQR